MDIEYLKKLNVKFNIIDEKEAANLISSEYPLNRLIEFASIFEQYKMTDKQGQFVNLEFAQLYYLTKIDERLRHILMKMCLEIEQKIKYILISDSIKLKVARTFLTEYIRSDYDYLYRHYSKELDLFISGDENVYTLDKFLDIITFGTFVKLVRAFYQQYAQEIYHKKHASFEQYLSSVHHIRNKAAHNVTLLSELNEKRGLLNPQVSEYLAKHGINSKTLKTNLSRTIVFDITSVMHLYCNLLSREQIKQNNKVWRKFVFKECRSYKKLFQKNEILKSAYRFSQKVVRIYSKKVT
ncbi:MAG: Abi family protein [Clostridiales bacterium]|nr:Abi family protein [Clostridiales bacterium]